MPGPGYDPTLESVEDVITANELDGVQAELPSPQDFPQNLPQRWPVQPLNLFQLRNDFLHGIRRNLEFIVRAAEDVLQALEMIEVEANARYAGAAVERQIEQVINVGGAAAERQIEQDIDVGGAAAEPQVDPDESVEGAAACIKTGPADWAKEPVDFPDTNIFQLFHKSFQSRNMAGPSCSFVSQDSKDIPEAVDDGFEKQDYADLAVRTLSLATPAPFANVSDLSRKPSASKTCESSSIFNISSRNSRQVSKDQPNSSSCDATSQVSTFRNPTTNILNISAIPANSRHSAGAAAAENLGGIPSSASTSFVTSHQQQPTDGRMPKPHVSSPSTPQGNIKQVGSSRRKPLNSASVKIASQESATDPDLPRSEKSPWKITVKPKEKLRNKAVLEYNTDKSSSSGEDTDDTLTPEDQADEKSDI